MATLNPRHYLHSSGFAIQVSILSVQNKKTSFFPQGALNFLVWERKNSAKWLNQLDGQLCCKESYAQQSHHSVLNRKVAQSFWFTFHTLFQEGSGRSVPGRSQSPARKQMGFHFSHISLDFFGKFSYLCHALSGFFLHRCLHFPFLYPFFLCHSYLSRWLKLASPDQELKQASRLSEWKE